MGDIGAGMKRVAKDVVTRTVTVGIEMRGSA